MVETELRGHLLFRNGRYRIRQITNGDYHLEILNHFNEWEPLIDLGCPETLDEEVNKTDS